MAVHKQIDRQKVASDSVRRALGFEPRRDPKNKKKGTKRKRPQKLSRKISRETRQIIPFVG